MIISAKNIPKYLHSIEFPVKILDEKGPNIALTVERTDFMALVDSQAIIANGSYKTIKHFRLNRPLVEVIQIRMRLWSGPPTATKLHYRDQLGDTMSLMVLKRHCGIRGSREYLKWDNSLTFEELRKDPKRMISADTQQTRDEARALRRFRQRA